MNLTQWLLVVVLVALPLTGFALRTWMKAVIEHAVQHQYISELEHLRAELRVSEERIRADLRTREAELAALRDSTIGANARRSALLDKRRIEAVQHLWAGVQDLSPFKAISLQMSALKFDVLAKRGPKEPAIRDLMTRLGGAALQQTKLPTEPDRERPFLSPLSWALFSAYRAVLGSAFARMKIIQLGIDEPEKLLSEESLRNMLAIALPTREEFIRTADVSSFHNLLDELESNMLDELKRMLVGEDDDEATVRRAARISKLAADVAARAEQGSASG